MKLGVCFSCFSGAEFLKPATQNVRQFSSHTVVVYSKTSNEGHPAPAYLCPLLDQLKSEGLVDEIIEHVIVNPSDKPLDIQAIQRQKREMGRQACMTHGCTHYQTRDCDEFYNVDEYARALKETETVDLSICRLYDYIGTPTYRARVISPLHVPFIQKIYCPMGPRDFGVLLDHERTCIAMNNLKFPTQQLMMHHMSVVRYNVTELHRKFQGHSHYMRLGQTAVDACFKLVEEAKARCDEVLDQFGIVEYWKNEFGGLYANVS
jgi:hypothetical protein